MHLRLWDKLAKYVPGLPFLHTSQANTMRTRLPLRSVQHPGNSSLQGS